MCFNFILKGFNEINPTDENVIWLSCDHMFKGLGFVVDSIFFLVGWWGVYDCSVSLIQHV